MEKFGWLYVGSGNIAKQTARSISRGNHRIVAVYGRTRAKVEEFAKAHNARAYTDFDTAVLSQGVDAVYIATPHTSHLQYAKRAMELGKSVLCEKPVGTSEKEVLELIAAAKENDVYFCEAMWTWFSDVALKVKEWVQSGKTGKIKKVHIDYKFPGVMMPKTSRVRMPETAGGALLDIGIYPITYCYNLFGKPSGINCKGKLRDGIDINETVTLHYDGFDCVLDIGIDGLKESCKITGEKGKITLGMFHMARVAKFIGKENETFEGRTNYLTEFTRVADEIKQGKKESDYVPFEATLECMKIMDECRRQMGLVYPFEKQ